MLIDLFTKGLNPDIVYELNYASVDKAALRVQDFLTGMRVEKNTMLRLRLSIEDVLLRWTASFPAGSVFPTRR